ncbi:Symplekin [Lamellibrachia satsuma]|nr:Symplekin [Lamellibrachia satsuma]
MHKILWYYRPHIPASCCVDKGGSVPSDDFKKPPLPLPSPAPNIPRKAMRAFKLSSVTKPLDRGTMDSLALQALERILLSEKTVKTGECASAQMKIATCLVAQFGGQLKDELQNFIFVDLRNRAEIALAWIYQEYANFQGYNLVTASAEKPNVASYDECLTRLLTGLLERPDQREGLFSRLILEAPYITPNAIQVLKKYCQDETRIYLGMTTLKELIVKRPCMKLEFLDVLLDFTSHEKNDVRNNAIRVTKKLHERKDLEEPIERYALFYLKYLLQSQPPPELPNVIHATGNSANGGWNEDSIKLCLYLYLGLLPINHRLIHELANVYTGTKPDIKRTILRVLETPVKGMGMDSPELLLLVDNCPKGAETLITRIIHILTDKAAPSQALVDRVRDLYHKRVSDVRFLIPVLTGLSKKEVVAALPKLIKLNPVVVKEVFNRLLGAHGQDRGYSSPLTPAELLIALHYVDTQKCDMKTIIKATNLCFAERTVYTQEVLAVVMQHLMEQSPLPTLLMRTVLQSLAMYPRLIGFVMNIMQRLITKQVWKQKKVWEGFVRCCQRTKPQSFQVLLQLPALQLKNAFEICPDLREPLLHHVKSFTPHQRAHIPKAIMTILEKDPLEEQRLQQRAKKVEEERLATQEKLYQHKLEEERHIQLEKARQRQQEEQEKKEQKDKEDQDKRQLEIKRDEDERKKMEEERERQQEQKEKEDQDERQLKIKRDEDERKKMEEERERQQADIKQEQEIKEKSDEEELDRKQKLAVKQEQTLEQESKQEEERQLEVARKQEQERKETKEREEQLAVQRLQQKEQEAVVMETDGIVSQDETCQPGPVCEATEPESVSDREMAMETSSDVTENMMQVRGSHRSCGTDNCQVDEARTEASATEVTGEGHTGDSAAVADSDTVLVKKSGKRRAVKDTEGKNKSKSAAVTKRRSPRTHKS